MCLREVNSDCKLPFTAHMMILKPSHSVAKANNIL